MEAESSPMEEAPTYAVRALRLTREEFVAAAPGPFLVGSDRLNAPEMPKRTDGLLDSQVGLRDLTPATLTVIAVHKTQRAFGNMITVGRTANNDIVIDDTHISRFHAFFRSKGGGYELADAGSRNGTFHGDARLVQASAPRRVETGDIVRFAGLTFRFVSPGACWDLLQSTLSRRNARETAAPRPRRPSRAPNRRASPSSPG